MKNCYTLIHHLLVLFLFLNVPHALGMETPSSSKPTPKTKISLKRRETDDPRHFAYAKFPIVDKKQIPAPLYKSILPKIPMLCIDVVLLNRATKKYKLVLRENEPVKGYWWLPGGRLFFGESFEDCARRQVNEEVGIRDVTIMGLVGAYNQIFKNSASYPSGEKGCHTPSITYLIETNETKTSLDTTQHLKSKWVSIYEENKEIDILEKIRSDALILLAKLAKQKNVAE